MVVVLLLIAEYSVYMSSLGLIAWQTERATGRDAFALVPALAIGLVAAVLFPVPAWLGIAVVGPCCAVLSLLGLEWLFRAWSLTLLEILVLAVAVLAAFDVVTHYAPLASGNGVRPVVFIAMAGAAIPWLQLLADRNSLRALATRLGVAGIWALRYWGQGEQKRTSRLVLLLFLPAVVIPLTTTGVLSGTILKDSVLAMLFARVCSGRPPVVLLAVAVSAAVLRLGVGYFVATNLGPPAVEAGLYLGGLVWLRMQGFRVEMGTVHDR
jgi:hypothetical protein